MFKHIFKYKEGKNYLFLKALTAVLSQMFSMALIIFPGLLINELSGEQRMPVVLLYIGMIAGIPFFAKCDIFVIECISA